MRTTQLSTGPPTGAQRWRRCNGGGPGMGRAPNARPVRGRPSPPWATSQRRQTLVSRRHLKRFPSGSVNRDGTHDSTLLHPEAGGLTRPVEQRRRFLSPCSGFLGFLLALWPRKAESGDLWWSFSPTRPSPGSRRPPVPRPISGSWRWQFAFVCVSLFSHSLLVSRRDILSNIGYCRSRLEPRFFLSRLV